jgi:hypothetical protein
LLTELDDNDFAVREQAQRALESAGESVMPELRQALTQTTSAEARRRLDGMIEKMERTVPAGKRLQALRGIEVLEQIRTPEARALLKLLAEGAPGTRVTREANGSLDRLTKDAIRP